MFGYLHQNIVVPHLGQIDLNNFVFPWLLVAALVPGISKDSSTIVVELQSACNHSLTAWSSMAYRRAFIFDGRDMVAADDVRSKLCATRWMAEVHSQASMMLQ